MIDFRSIRYTTAGLECHYLGQRRSGDQVLHRFAVVNPAGERFEFYNDKGQRIEYVSPGRWEVRKDGHQIIEQKPPKIVETTRWIGLFITPNGKYYTVQADNQDDLLDPPALDIQQHTFRFEVPNES